jgi:hypothetical protein
MPLYIRHLPGSVSQIVDETSLPPNQALFNPSYAHPMLYLRATRHTNVDETNFVVLFNTDSKSQHVIESPMDKLAKNVNLFKGIEDLRICWFGGKLWFAGTTTHATDRMTNELIVGHFDASLTKVERISAVGIGSLPVKNVCPFVWKDALHLLDTFKRKIYQIRDVFDETTKEWKAYKALPIKDLTGVTTEEFRGSTSPIHLHGNTWGCVVHDIIFNDNTKLVTRLSYIHHWMEFDVESGQITFVSSPFWVARWGIEYVSGIYRKPDTDHILLYVGVADRLPVMVQTTLHDLRVGK